LKGALISAHIIQEHCLPFVRKQVAPGRSFGSPGPKRINLLEFPCLAI